MSKLEHTCTDEDRHLDLICRGCLKKIIAKKDKLLEFVWKTYDLSLCREENNCDCVRCEARELLKEIGELND